MTRQGLPTGQMEQETQELLDEYNDMVDFIKEHGEKDFREYYETYNRICEDYGKELVDAYVEIYYTNGIEHFEDAYQGEWGSGADFAEHLSKDCGYISDNIPYWIVIDWERTWEANLRHDYTEINGHIFHDI